jgi:large repetitive protein
MKNNTILKKLVFVLIFTIGTISLNAQIKNPFDVRFQTTVRGDLTMISNNIVNRSPNPNTAYNTTGSSSSYNDDVNMQYIDIDGNNQTFNSSSANLTIADAQCSNIVHAGLYWSATYRYNIGNDPSSGRATDWNQVKFRVPGGTYVDVIADEVLYNGFADSNQTNVGHGPYGCFADVTALVAGLANPNGTYFVGNIRVSQNGSGSSSFPISGGVAGGWTLVIVYENINLPGKKITTFDGYAVVASTVGNLDIPVSGFSTLPAPFPVRAKLGISTLEGDNRITGDQLRIKANSVATFTNLTNTPPPTPAVNNNYFNSSITLNGAFNTARNPNSTNTLGWDAHLNAINNPANSVIPNNETGVTLRAVTTGDKYDVFFASFDVEIIEPQIPLIKEVEDTAGNNVNNQTLALGQELFYTLTFQNTGCKFYDK